MSRGAAVLSVHLFHKRMCHNTVAPRLIVFSDILNSYFTA